MALGDALQGFSRGLRTGLTGESGESQRKRREETGLLQDQRELFKAKLENALGIKNEKHLKAMAIDDRKGAVMLEQGMFDALGDLNNNRLKAIKKHGGDTKHTDARIELLERVKGGDQEALTELTQSYAAGELGAVLSFPDILPRTEEHKKALGMMAKQAEVIPQSAVSEENTITVRKPDGSFENVPVGGIKKPESLKDLDRTLKLENDKFVRAKKIRDEIDILSKDFIKIEDAWDRIQAAGKSPTAAGDLALIFNYMKMLDPGSVVRESEFATAEDSRSLPEGMRARVEKIRTGERLGPNQRKDFLDRAQKLYEKSKKTNTRRTDQRYKIGAKYGLTKEDIFGTEVVEAEGDSGGGEDRTDEDLLNQY